MHYLAVASWTICWVWHYILHSVGWWVARFYYKAAKLLCIRNKNYSVIQLILFCIHTYWNRFVPCWMKPFWCKLLFCHQDPIKMQPPSHRLTVAWKLFYLDAIIDRFHINTKLLGIVPLVNKKAELSQSWPRDAPCIWVPWKFSGVPDNAHGYTFPEFLMGFCSDWAHKCACKIW